MANSQKPDEGYKTDSVLALGRIPADSEENIAALEKAAMGWVQDQENAFNPRALQYFENASYLQGNHLTRFFHTPEGGFGAHTFGVSDSSQFDHLIAKSADNRLIRPVETVVGMLTSDLPWPRVEPNSRSIADEDAAKISEIVVDLLFEFPLRMRERRREMAMIAAMMGLATIEVEYGETDIPVVVPKMVTKKVPNPIFPDDEDIEVTEEHPTETEVEMRRDIMARVWTPFHITPDPMATSFSDLSWIHRGTFEDAEWIADNFAKDEEGFVYGEDEWETVRSLPDDAPTRHPLYWWTKMNEIIESPQYYQQSGGLTPSTLMEGGYAPGQIYFSVIDVKPTPEHPRGRTLIFAGTKLLYHGPARAWTEKYPWRWHPYAFFGWFQVPGKFYPVALLSQLVPLQKKINAIDALVQANRQLMSIGQWKIPKHARVANGSISGIPGDHLIYTAAPGMPAPERVNHTPLPSELLIERQTLIEAIDSIAASGVIGKDVAASAARSGPVLDFLRNEKLRSKTPMIQGFQEMLETVAQNVLIDIQENLVDGDEELQRRLLQAARQFSTGSIENFTGASLRDHHAVSIDISSEFMRSPEARAEMAIQVGQYLGPQMTAEERQGIFKATKLSDFMANAEDMSVTRARRMIERIVSGQIDAAIPMPRLDNPMVMAPVFQNEILSDRFYDYDEKVAMALLGMFDHYAQEAAAEAQRQFQLELARAQAGGGAPADADQGGE